MKEIERMPLVELIRLMGELEKSINASIEEYNILNEELIRRFPPLKEVCEPKKLIKK